MMRGQYNVHTYVHILCGETNRDVYGVSSMEKLTSVIGVAKATQCVCWCSVVAAGVIYHCKAV